MKKFFTYILWIIILLAVISMLPGWILIGIAVALSIPLLCKIKIGEISIGKPDKPDKLEENS